MKPTNVTVKELVSYLPSEIIDDLAEATGVDHQVKSLTGKDVFLLLLYTHFKSKDESLRVIETLSSSKSYQAFAGKSEGYKVPHTTLSDRLSTIKVSFVKSIFESYSSVLKNFYSPKECKSYDIYRYDSTFLSLSSKLLHFGMSNGRKSTDISPEKRQLKFTIGFNGIAPTDVKMYKEQTDISDDASFREVILSHIAGPKEISIFDRGCKKRTTFKEFWEHDILFVTKINPTSNYQEVGGLMFSKNDVEDTEKLTFKKDISVYLRGDKGICKVPLRLIVYTSKDTGEDIYFLTNIYFLKASEISYIYKKRWDIEVFFKFIKQELGFNHFLSRNENGIMVSLYIMLIAATMLLIYKKANDMKGYKIMKLRFCLELETEIMKIIVRLCGGCPEKVDNLPPNLGFGQ
jgi:hypothetical protein